MSDAFSSNQSGLESPIEHAESVTPNNDSDLPNTTRALWIGTGGDIVITTKGGTSSVTLESVPDGSMLPIRVSRVHATGTTATGIVALW